MKKPDAKKIQEMTLEHTAKALKEHGISSKIAAGIAGVHLEVFLASIPERSLKVYVKASNPEDSERPRRFRIAIPMGELMHSRNLGQDFDELWTERIYAADYHIFYASRPKEFWIFPAHKTFEMLHDDAAADGGNLLNVLDAASPLKQQAKDFDLDEEKDGVPLELKLDYHRNNFELILHELEEG